MHNYNNNTLGQAGFTLVELLVTVAIVGISVAMGIPHFKETMLKNKTSAYASDFKMALYVAQSEAIKRGTRVTVRSKNGTSQNWSSGWDIFQDHLGTIGTQDTGEELVQTYVPDDTTFTLKTSTTAFANWISFSASGLPLGASGESDGEFRLCRPDADTGKSHTINISYAGNITNTEGTSSCP